MPLLYPGIWAGVSAQLNYVSIMNTRDYCRAFSCTCLLSSGIFSSVKPTLPFSTNTQKKGDSFITLFVPTCQYVFPNCKLVEITDYCPFLLYSQCPQKLLHRQLAYNKHLINVTKWKKKSIVKQ